MSLWLRHQLLERNSILLILGILLVIAIGGIVEIGASADGLPGLVCSLEMSEQECIESVLAANTMSAPYFSVSSLRSLRSSAIRARIISFASQAALMA